MLVQEGLTVADALAATAKREADALARFRKEVDPHYDPWRPVPTTEEMQARAAAAATTATAAATGATAAPEARAASAAEARIALRAAHAAHATALADRERADAIVARARARTDAADAEMQSFADLDAQITAWTAQQIRDDAAAEMPFALANAQRERSRAIDRVDAAHKALDVLAAEARAAERAADAAAAVLATAAAALLLAHAEQLADGLAAIEAEALARRTALVALAGVWFPPGSGRPGPVPLSPRLRRLLADPPPNAAATLNPTAVGDPAAQAPWLALHAALVADPAADADDPDDADPGEPAAAPPG